MKLLKRSLVLLGCALAAAAAFTACELGLGGDDRLETSQGSGTGTGGNTGNTGGTTDTNPGNSLIYSVALGTDNSAYPVELSSVKVNGEEKLSAKTTITEGWSDGYKVSDLSGADEWTVAFTFTVTKVGGSNWNDFNWEIRDDSTDSDVGLGYWGGRYDNYMVGWLEGYHEFGDWGNEHLVEEGNAAFGGHWYGVGTNTLKYDHSETLNKTCVLTVKHTAKSIAVSLTSEGTEVWSCVNDAI